jgi:spore coat protein A, manganese oxidase
VDVVVDFAHRLNQKIVLQNLAGDGPLRQLMQFRVTRDLTDTSSVPSKLRPLPALDATSAVTRTFEFGRTRLGGQWTINGKTFDPDRVDAQPVLGTTETWIFTNKSGSNHIVHIHGIDQQLVSRDGAAPTPFERVKESWNLGIGKTIVLKVKFTDNVGKFVLHCHILEHEDAGMMAQYEVVP